MVSSRERAVSLGRAAAVAALALILAQAGCRREPAGPEPPRPSAVAVVAPQTVIVVGESVQLSAVVYDQRGKVIPGSVVIWESRNPPVATVSSTGLVTGVSPGTAAIRATSGSIAGEVTIRVDPDPCTTPMALQPGEVRVLSGPAAVACVTLAPTTGPSDFLFVTANAAQEADNVGFYSVAVDLLAAPLSNLATESPVQDLLLRREQERTAYRDAVEDRVRRQEGELFRKAKPILRSLPLGEQPRLALAPQLAAEGDTLTFRVPDINASNLCTTYREVRAVVKKISPRGIIVQDVAAPAGGFTATDFNEIAAEWESLIYPTDTLYFGRETDRNGDGRVTILYTPEVNRATPQGAAGFVAGFFWGGDLVKKSEYQRAGVDCPQTNEQEIFYMLVPDPNGTINGNQRSVSMVRQNTRGTIAHEFQHMINQGQRLLNPAVDSVEVPWLNEALSHLAEEIVGRVLRGFSDFQQLTFADVNPTPSASADYDAFFRQNLVRFRSWMQRPDTSSPTSNKARNQLAPRGAAWMFLRYVTDHFSNNNAKAFLRRVVAGPDIGLRNLRQQSGAQFDDMLRGFLVSQFTSGLGIQLLDPTNAMRSWNVRNVMAAASNNVFPLLVTTLPANVTTQSLSGSGNYFRLTRSSAAPAATFRMLGQGGAPVDFPGARVYVLRLN
jgi:hypothetical protein